MTDFVERATSFVHVAYPQACAAFLGGSAASGEATDTSDLDILIVLPGGWSSTSFVETTTYAGQLVEAFVYGCDALQTWLAKGRAERRPVLDRLIGQGVPLVQGEIGEQLASTSRKVLETGPMPLDQDELRLRRYSLSAALDDVEDATDLGVRTVAMAVVWREAAELALMSTNCWIGTGKWLLRELRANGDKFDLAAWADNGGRDERALIKRCWTLLDSVGGYLQNGLLRGEKPGDL